MQQAGAGHHLLTQRLDQLEADLLEAIQDHRANSAELVRRISRLERHMDSPGLTKVDAHPSVSSFCRCAMLSSECS